VPACNLIVENRAGPNLTSPRKGDGTARPEKVRSKERYRAKDVGGGLQWKARAEYR